MDEFEGSVSARASKYRCAELKPVVTQAASKKPSTATVLRRSQPSSARAVARDLTEPGMQPLRLGPQSNYPCGHVGKSALGCVLRTTRVPSAQRKERSHFLEPVRKLTC